MKQQGLPDKVRAKAKEAVREAIIGGHSVFTLDRLIQANEQRIRELTRQNDAMVYYMLAKGA